MSKHSTFMGKNHVQICGREIALDAPPLLFIPPRGFDARDFLAVFRDPYFALATRGEDEASSPAAAPAEAFFPGLRDGLEALLCEHHSFLKRHLPQRCPCMPEQGVSSLLQLEQGVVIFSSAPLMYMSQPACVAPALA